MAVPITEARARANKKWLDENYARLAVSVPKELADSFKEVCKANGTSYNSVVRSMIEEYIRQERGE